MREILLFINLTGIFLLLTACQKKEGIVNSETVQPASEIALEEISPEVSGIHFNNQISDQGRVNIFTWHFLYNGAGVATGDINNDGLPDIYFAGNMVQDKLYLNKGDFKFEDISQKAGIIDNLWSTGVTMADVNGDGYLDIYVCKNSATGNMQFNRNKLYINNGDLSFTEKAAQYGIDDPGFGVQASFFDADQDGDLDMYLVNQPFDEFAMLVNNPQVVESYPKTDRFFFFENGRFVDRTATLGMENARYGLNVSIGDFDLNGWTDLYICNDYWHADHLYMNVGGKFTDALLSNTPHISFYSMGSDVADINNDGLLDLFTLDMAFEDHYRSKTNMGSMDPDRFWRLVADSQHYQYMQNNLQLNMGGGQFAEIAQISGVARTDWSYAALFADLDLDAFQDLLITNGILRDLQNNDFNDYVKQAYQGRVGPQNFQEVMGKLPSNPVKNLIYQNQGDLRFNKLPPAAGFSKDGFSHGMAYADFDKDGKLDVVINNMNAPASIYRNVTKTEGNWLILRLKGPGSNLQGLGSTVQIFHNGQIQAGTMQSTRGYFSACEPFLHFGLGGAEKIDSILVYWNHKAMSVLRNVEVNKELLIDFGKELKIPARYMEDGALALEESDIISHMHQEDPFDDYAVQVLLPYKLSQNGPFLARGDVNGDGLDDLFVGGAKGYAGSIYLSGNGGKFTRSEQPALYSDRAFEDQQGAFFDLDGDGDLDLYVTSGSNEFDEADPLLRHRLYINDGKGNFSAAQGGILPDRLINGQVVTPFDADNDGDTDLFVGGRLTGGKYPVPSSSAIFINEGGRLLDRTEEIAPFLVDLGLVTGASVDDIDGDGDLDLFLVGEWMSPTILFNDGERGFEKVELKNPGSGLWWTVEKIDADGDGDSDFVLGNLGWNNKFGGSRGTKLEVYANDFDSNGDFDVVLANTKNGKLLPVRGRECSSQEMPFILDKFPSFDSFGRAELIDILPVEAMERSVHRKLSTMSSVLMINEGDGKFSVKELPHLCQHGPIKAFAVIDWDKDGYQDFFFAGNHYPTEVETARYDGLYPGICLNDGKGNFRCKLISVNKRLLTGDFRSMIFMEGSAGKSYLLMANNAGPLRMLALPLQNPQ